MGEIGTDLIKFKAKEETEDTISTATIAYSMLYRQRYQLQNN